MATTSFHPFSRLPTELRLQIWEQTYGPQRSHQRGIHYMGIDIDPIRKSLKASHPGSVNEPVRSACLLNTGLWTACRESREVARKQTERVESGMRIKVKGNNDSRDGPCLVSPFKDVFCIRVCDSWKNTSGDVPLAWQMGVQVIPGHMQPFTCTVDNIALEFDPSWIIDFPTTHQELAQERTPRGFLWRHLEDQRINYRSSKRTIWLIDRETRWAPFSDTGCRLSTITYVDGTGEYVEGHLDEECFELHAVKKSQVLQNFWDAFRRFLAIHEFDCVDTPSPPSLFCSTGKVRRVRFLFRRERQLELRKGLSSNRRCSYCH